MVRRIVRRPVEAALYARARKRPRDGELDTAPSAPASARSEASESADSSEPS